MKLRKHILIIRLSSMGDVAMVSPVIRELLVHNKNYKIIGIDNNSRKKFFGSTASVEWSKKYLIKKYNNYNHYNLDITNINEIKKIFFKRLLIYF